MSRGRRLAVPAGVLTVVCGVLVAAVPSLAPDVTAATLATIVVALAAFLLGAHAAYVRSRQPTSALFAPGRRTTPTPPPEADLTVALDDVTGVPGPVETQARAATYLDVRTLAIEELVRVEDCSRTAARRLLDTGEWTDDTVAADFFVAPTPTWRDRLREWVTAQPTFQRRAIRAVAAVDRLATTADAAPVSTA